MYRRFLVAGFVWMAVLSAHARTLPFSMERLSIHEGLSSNVVYAIVQDTLGYLWFGTADGLDRYDGRSVVHYDLRMPDSEREGGMQVNCLLSCDDGELLVGTSRGLNIYLRDRDIVVPYEPASLLKRMGIRTLAQDGSVIWIGTNRGLFALNRETNVIRHFESDPDGLAHNIIRALYVDGDYLFVGTFDGMSRYDKRTGKWQRKILKSPSVRLPRNNLVLSIIASPYNEDELLIGTQTGLCEVNRYTLEYELHEKSHDRTMSNNTIKTMAPIDDKVWMGTEAGFMIYDGEKFFSYGYEPYNQFSLPDNIVWTIYRDRDDIMWVGTDGGIGKSNMGVPASEWVDFVGIPGNNRIGISIFSAQIAPDNSLWLGSRFGLSHYDPVSGRMTWKEFPNLIPGTYNPSRALSLDERGLLWVGTAEGVLCYDTLRDRLFVVQDQLEHNLKYIHQILAEEDGTVYVCDISGRIQVIRAEFDPVRRVFTSLEENLITLNKSVGSMAVSKEYIWVGGRGRGIIRYRKSDGKIDHFKKGAPPCGLSSNVVNCLYVDPSDCLWAGTNDGINRYDKARECFVRVASEVILGPIYSLQSDSRGMLWFTTPYHVGCWNSRDATCNFFLLNGRTDTGRGHLDVLVIDDEDHVYIMKLDGYVRMDPVQNHQARARVPLRMTHIDISGNSLCDLGLNGKGSIETLDRIELRHNQNSLTFQFAVMSYVFPSLCRYQYILEGYDTGWNRASGDSEQVAYHRLEPGNYTLRVKAVSEEGIPAANEISLSIRIRHPWYSTGWAYAVYLLLAGGCIWLIWNYFTKRNAILAELNNERLEREKIEEINQVKLRFFTNVSHDFRTPLSLIISPVDSLLENESDSEKIECLRIVKQNAQRLLRLVNQVLDFRKVEMQRMKLNMAQTDIVALIRNVVLTFNEIAEKKGITFLFESGTEHLVSDFDADKVEKIFFNLISNALKFTEPEGQVIVNIQRKDTEWVEIMVADTGICIPDEDLPHIFERFYQVQQHSELAGKGSGIGLTIVKEFVDMHGGKIQVMSKAGVGTTFFVTLPIVNEQDVPVDSEEESLNECPEPPESCEPRPSTRQSVLLVEDNEDMRSYLAREFAKRYDVEACATGEAGWKLIRERMPDIVVLDVMLPGMSGIELCRMIKTEFVTSHIPIILLTARTAEENVIEGFDAGADEYMPKPFNLKMLLRRIDNILTQRQRFRENLKRDTIQVTPLDMQSPDKVFIDKVVELIEQRIDDPELNIPYLCDKLAVSHVSFYRKIKSITGLNVNMFIREVRLKKAAQMLRVKGVSVSDVMYDVGFNHRSYFSMCFKEMFGVTPKVYAQRYNSKESR